MLSWIIPDLDDERRRKIVHLPSLQDALKCGLIELITSLFVKTVKGFAFLMSVLVLPLPLPLILVVAIRLLDEEKFLAANLSGYQEYRQKVRYRLVPYVW